MKKVANSLLKLSYTFQVLFIDIDMFVSVVELPWRWVTINFNTENGLNLTNVRDKCNQIKMMEEVIDWILTI